MTRVALIFIQAILLACAVGNTELALAKPWEQATPESVDMDPTFLAVARDYALTGGGSGMIVRHGKRVMSWGDTSRKYDLKSTSKSIGVTALGLAMADGKINLHDKAVEHHPEFAKKPAANQTSGRRRITIQHLATQTAGFEKPGGYEPIVFSPGTKWHYSDGGPNWLAECVTLAYGRDVEELMFERVFTPIGIRREDLRWRKNQYRPHKIEGIPRREFGSGVHANVNAMARIGQLYLRRGEWDGRQLIPAEFVDRARATLPEVVGLPEHVTTYDDASEHYGLLWWNNADGSIADVPRDAYWSWGLYESLIVVIPSLDVVVARAGKSWKRREGGRHYEVLEPFFRPIVKSVKTHAVAAADHSSPQRSRSSVAPYPRSKLIAGIRWAPAASVTRKADGSDNWPLTWGDDDNQYTAYGDGWGFVPKVKNKLSMGFARISGSPASFTGSNVRSETGETRGPGADGKKASGILMIDGVLYLWVRNAANSQLAWSSDRGATWSWSDWHFTTSFGCPTFLNFGQNYQGARDEFVYTYSLDGNTAYDPVDQMVLARVPKDKLRDRSAYEFFQKRSEGGPTWTKDIKQRGPVFRHPGRCYRSGVTYNSGLERYLWVQVHPESSDRRGPRFEGSFAVYEAPEPWGPWSTVYFTAGWDMGPGETASFPTKWMSEDGKSLHLVFSGNDYFSVRKATLVLRE